MPFILDIGTPPQPPALTPSATAPITPHVQIPFALNANGRPTYCDQDSVEDVESCVMNIVSCPQGDNPYDSDFGRPDFRGQPIPMQLSGLTQAVTKYEPRLQDVSAEQALSTVTGVVQVLLSGDVD